MTITQINKYAIKNRNNTQDMKPRKCLVQN